MRIHLIPNSHIDPVWLWDKYEGIDEVINTFRSACDRLDEYPDLTFAASSLQFYEWVQQFDARLFERIVQKVHEHRWEIVGGWWVEADTNLPSEASFIKHAEISQDFAHKHFGREITVAYLPDTFGHPATLPKILACTGFKYLVFCRPGEQEKSDLPSNLFRWEYEGHHVLAYRLKHHYTQVGFGEDRLLSLLNDEEYRQNPVNGFFFGVGDHGGGPSIAEIEFFNRFINGQPAGDAGYSTCLRFFDEAVLNPNIPTYCGDLHRYAVGCYSVLRDLKDAVRCCEHGLQFASRALAINGETNACLGTAWKTMLFNQFHDILPGSCSPNAAEQAKAELGGVQSVWRDTAYRALKSFSKAHRTFAPQGEFRIFNTLPFDVTVPLHIESFGYYDPNAAFKDEDGKEILLQEVLPSVRFANRRWEFVDSLPAQKFKSYYFDNETIVERAAPGASHFQKVGESSTKDKQTGAEKVIGKTLERILESPVRFLVLDDKSDTWGHGVDAFDTVEGVFVLVSSADLSGPVTDKLYQQWSYGKSTLQAVYSFYKHLPGIYVEFKANWREERKILKIEICLSGVRSPVITMQGAGGPIERRTDGKEMPLHHWIWVPALEGGLCVVQDGAFACDCTAERLRLTFVRSSVYSFHDPYQLNPADPQQFTDQGEHKIRLHFRALNKLDAEAVDRLSFAFLEPYPVIRECGESNQTSRGAAHP
jgi:alpha-mannosidase